MTIIIDHGDYWIEDHRRTFVIASGADGTTTISLDRGGRYAAAYVTIERVTVGDELLMSPIMLRSVGGGAITFGTSITQLEVRNHNDSGLARTFDYHIIVILKK